MKKRYLKYKKERVILSDVLPYEVPITFSNRHFYEFIIKNKIEYKEGKIHVHNASVIMELAIKLIFGIDLNIQFSDSCIGLKDESSIPFGYKIVHKENDFRELSIIHPKNQLILVDFYNKYKELILHYCTLSPFSIRKPHRIAKYTYYKDRFHLENIADDASLIEQHDKEYEQLKTFFVYKQYSNIHKFYESYIYHRSEKKYNKLFKFDVSKCFDSIYTHSIMWALFNKSTTKKFINDTKETFGSKFDKLIQNLNYSETNGIVIGPEFSRIFAELILQRVDLEVKKELENDACYFKADYEAFRYVDDYFLFYNDESVKEKIVALFRLKLKEFKLYLNDSKADIYDKPIITSITIAKQKIIDLISKHINYDIQTEILTNDDTTVLIEKHGKIDIDSNRLITKFKTIIFESTVEYKDVLNYTFSLIEKRLRKVVKDYFEIVKDKNSQRNFINSLLELLDFVFFLYTVSPRVNTTIKLCKILRIITETIGLKNKFNVDFKHLVFKKIHDNILFTLQKNKAVKYTQVETLYLLIALSELGKEYWLEQDVLAKYLGVTKDGDAYQCESVLNYFTIIVSLFYMRNKKRYADLSSCIQQHLKYRFENVDIVDRRKCSELIFLLFDTISCPYVSLDTKKYILSLYNVTNAGVQEGLINLKKNWFTNWQNFNFGKALDAKNSQEVY